MSYFSEQMNNIANDKSKSISKSGLFAKDNNRIEEVSERSAISGNTSRQLSKRGS